MHFFERWGGAPQWALLIPLSVVLVGLFDHMGIPSAPLLGPVVVSAVMGIRGTGIRVPRPVHEFAQGIAGCLIAHYLSPEIFQAMALIWPTVLVFVLMTLLIACLVGWLVGSLTSIDGEVAIWGFLPGMAGAVIAMSHDRGLDSRMVAFIQILRLILVILIMSLVSWALVGGTPMAAPRGGTAPLWPGLPMTLLIAACGPLVGRYAPMIPAGATLVPLLLAGALQGSGTAELALPGWLLICGYFVLGAQVGLRFTPEIIRHGIRALPTLILAVLGVMALCALSGLVLSMMLGLDILTGVLATVPGSIDSIALLAITGHADVSFVMTMQVARLFAVVLAGPFLARLLCRWAFPSI